MSLRNADRESWKPMAATWWSCYTVIWEPYNEEDVLALPLNHMCTRDQDLWRMRCPLICFYAVEIHLPDRVARQFGLEQAYPLDAVSTSIELHKFDRIRQRKVTDFAHHHRDMIEWWNRMDDNVLGPAELHRNATFRDYLTWYHSATRYKLRQRWTGADYADIASSEDDDTTYDKKSREGNLVELAPILDRVGTSIRDSVTDIKRFLQSPPSTYAREFLQKLKRRLKRTAARCGCRAQVLTDMAAAPSHRSSSQAVAASSSHGTAGHSAVQSSSRTFSSNNGEEDDDEEDEEEGEGDEGELQDTYDELGMSQLPDAPAASQPARRRRQPPSRLTTGTDALGKGKGKGKARRR